MRYSTAILALSAGMAMASPLKQPAKKDFIGDILTEYDVVTDIAWVTVTADPVIQQVTAAATSVVVVTASSTVLAAAPSIPPYTPPAILQGLPNYGYWSSQVVEPSSSDVAPAAATSSIVQQTTPVAPFSYITVTQEPSPTSVAVAATSAAPVSSAAPTTVESSPTVAAASSSTSNDASVATSTDLVTASLYHHNVHRTNHSAPAVDWNGTLASYAATVAASCVYAHDLTPGNGGYGQNIAVYGETGDVEALGEAHQVAQASTDMWYNGEINSFLPEYYGEDNPDFSNFDAWGHFSQMVWKSTEEIGCASQYCDAGTIFSGFGSWFTVCNYGPEGNMGGEYGDNVLEPLGDATVVAAV